jgi:hypothetical protein
MRERFGLPLLSFLAVLLALSGCAPVQLISSYDETTELAASQLQRDFAAFFVRIASATDPEQRAFKNNIDFYREAAVDFSALQVRVGAIYRNQITSGQIDLTQTNFAYLILLHKGCVTGPLTDAQRAAVEQMGPDLSMDCQTLYDASQDVKNRGDVRLSPIVASVPQKLIDQQLGAILALELAKKRGEDKE